MKLTLQATGDLLKRYAEAFRSVWAIRDRLDTPPRTEEERAFLPAHLELLETPAHPAAYWTLRLIIALLIVAFLWACIGKVDVVAVAPGKAVVSSRTKTVQAPEAAVVRRILVQDGQAVRKGQVLIELDPTAPQADLSKASDAVLDARLAELRLNGFLQALDGTIAPRLPMAEDVPGERVGSEQQRLSSDVAAYRAQHAALQTAVRQRVAELATAEASIGPLTENVRIARTRAEDYAKLVGDRYVGRHDYLIREQERVSAEQALTMQRGRIVEIRAALVRARDELRTLETTTRQQALEALATARAQFRQLTPESDKAALRTRLSTIVSPVDGTVQQLAVHTVGGVVTPAQPLLAVVPSNEALEVEATVLNRDIGFIRPGQRATIKVESFPYTRYGYLEGVVESVSHDAAQNDALGLVFPARVRLDRDSIRVGDLDVRITPGMALSVEIKTARRSLIDYVLSPLQRHQQESFRER